MVGYHFSDMLELIGRLVCHQIAERSIFINGLKLPLCARCTGVYAGAFICFIIMIMLKRFKGNKPFDISAMIFVVFCLFPLIIDGIGSYAGFWQSNNILRLSTGVFFGFGVVVCMILAANFSVYGVNNDYIIKNTAEAAGIVVFILAICFFVYLGMNLYYAAAVISICGVFTIWFLIARAFCTAFKTWRNTYEKK